jgi:maleylacetoacetate isomerase
VAAPAAIRLHGFFNSSAAYRVRIALNLKGLGWEHVGVNLRAGAQNQADYQALNPTRLVPTLDVAGHRLGQSLAIIDHLDRLQPEPLLVPAGGPARDRVLEIAQLIACDIHPLNNLRVLKYLTGPLALTEAQKNAWMAHWIGLGFDALEALLAPHATWAVGDAPTLADCCLVPQVANARRAGIDVAAWPAIARVDALAARHAAFQAAAPNRQPDFIPA